MSEIEKKKQELEQKKQELEMKKKQLEANQATSAPVQDVSPQNIPAPPVARAYVVPDTPKMLSFASLGFGSLSVLLTLITYLVGETKILSAIGFLLAAGALSMGVGIFLAFKDKVDANTKFIAASGLSTGFATLMVLTANTAVFF